MFAEDVSSVKGYSCSFIHARNVFCVDRGVFRLFRMFISFYVKLYTVVRQENLNKNV